MMTSSPTRDRGLVRWRPTRARLEAPSEPWLKRPFDVTLSLVGLALGVPIFAGVSLLIKLEDGGPVFYTQHRVGFRGREFRLIKFRSMVVDAEAATGPTPSSKNDPRATRVGRVLRRTACDELPQLLNILIGDMSFVGPRSHREFFYERARAVRGLRDRCRIRPGLTGLAQVLGRTDSTAAQKLRFDLLYIKHQSFLLDLKLVVSSLLITALGKWDQRTGKKLPWVHAVLRMRGRRRRAARPVPGLERRLTQTREGA